MTFNNNDQRRDRISRECIFDADIRCRNFHSVIDLATRKCIYYAKDVEIQAHVWLVAHAFILKQVSIDGGRQG